MLTWSGLYVKNIRNIASMSENLNASSEEISTILQKLGERMRNTKQNSEVILTAIEETKEVVKYAVLLSKEYESVAEKLTHLGLDFKI